MDIKYSEGGRACEPLLWLHEPWVGKDNEALMTPVPVPLGPLFSWNDATDGPSVFKSTEVSLASYHPALPKLPLGLSLSFIRTEH